MTYLPLARKYRPQEFDEVIGQEHITTILKNAISMKRVHHAYLFTGPRGIGKTSTARILSKALNCEKGPAPKPCNRCVFCQEIIKGNSLDVIEIDGASNRGIDEIRNLRETVKFAPSRGLHKIYIIDEVHMLTTEAFNALLKTLEEPPLHVKFIFATTEPHKLPATILSRCQRFDFRRIPTREIAAKLREVAKEEKLNVEDDVFLHIARVSDGSMRDAESILDQVSSFSKEKVKLKDVVESLGMIGEELLFQCADLIISRDAKGALYFIDGILNSGKGAKQFLSEILEHFRNIMIVKSGATPEELIDLSSDAIAQIKKQAQGLSRGDIFYIINVISNGMKMIKQLLPERIVLELSMIKLASRDSISSIEEILSKLPEVNKTSHGTEVNPKHEDLQQVIAKKMQPGYHHNPDTKLAQVSPLKAQKTVSHESAKPSTDMTRVKNAWPILVKAMAVKKMSISSYLSEGEPESIKADTIFVGFPKELNFHREVLDEKHNKTSIEAALSQILDVSVKLQFVLTDRKLEEPVPATVDMQETLTKEELKKKEPLIDTALNIFGGKIMRTRST
ncbi:MAG: DNA polymerase III subunit gamma/tau [Candidatus Omnitrophica bacterium]|nr:DNA polymerase III subunit gamma/tau [Candidatus Omnitrophota bacterium]